MADEQAQPNTGSNAADTIGSCIPIHIGFGIFLASLASWIGIVMLGLTALSIWIGSLL